MRKFIFQALFVTFAFLSADLGLTSCASSSHCPAVAGTGNSASHKSGGLFGRKKYCAGVKGTGTSKPRVKKKREDGLTSKKMERQMAKAKKKKAGPIDNKKLSMDQ